MYVRECVNMKTTIRHTPPDYTTLHYKPCDIVESSHVQDFENEHLETIPLFVCGCEQVALEDCEVPAGELEACVVVCVVECVGSVNIH
jgi:hypothetical protein